MRKFLIPVALLFCFASCKKSDSCTLSATSIQGTYKITSISYKATSSSSAVDEFATWDACEKDDHITFASGGVVTISDVGAVCSTPGDDTDTWGLTGNTLVLGSAGALTVSNYSCSGFTVTNVIDSSTGESETITFARV